MEWLHRAACVNEDPDLFFPVGESGPAQDQMEVARQVCLRCEVREDCLAWALETGMDHGVLGATTPAERRQRRRLRPGVPAQASSASTIAEASTNREPR